MGIDLWVPRDRPPDAPAPVASPKPEKPAAAELPAGRVWTVVAAGDALLLGELPMPPDRRLAHDIVRAAAGYPTESPAPIEFRESGGHSPGALLAFLRGQMDRRRTHLVIVLGAAVSALEPPGAATEPFRWHDIQGVPCLAAPGASELRADPDLKQGLWRALIHR